MTIKDRIKIECIKKNKTLTSLANELGISKSNLHHHLLKKNGNIIRKVEEILELKSGFFEDNTVR